MNTENNIKPTLPKPVSKISKNYQTDFDNSMGNNGDILTEVDGLLNEKEQSLKKKIFSLAKMESLVFSDPKLTAVYDEMSANGEEKYGYHYNETIMNMLFNDYVLNSSKYLQKYKMAIPKKKKRRDKSGINQLKKSGEVDFNKTEPQNTNETTTSASSGAYVGPAAWGGGDLMKGKSSLVSRSPIWNGGTIIQESNYLVDVSGFKKYYELLNEDTSDYITDNTNAFSSTQVDNWSNNDKAIQVNTINSGTIVESEEFNKIKGELGDTPEGADFRCDDKGNMQLFYYSDNNNAKQWALNASNKYKIPACDTKNIGNKKINEEMGVEEFILTVKHDNGTVKIKNTASSEEAAINNVMTAEGCPRRAIISVSKSKNINEGFDDNDDDRESLGYFLSFNNDDIYWQWINEEISSQEAINMVYELDGIEYDPNVNYKTEYGEVDEESMIADNQTTMAFKPQPASTVSNGGIETGMNVSSGMNETDEFITDLNEELEKLKKQQEKIKKMTEDRKPSSLVLKDRLGDENKKNFKSDLNHSGTKDTIDIEKELMWKDQQTEIKDPQKFNQDIEKEVLKRTKGQSFENVGDSTNEKGNEIPKRNLTQEEQDEVNNYRLGLGDYIYANKPSEKFEERMKQDMGDTLYKQRQDKLKFRSEAPMYNKDPQPVQTTTNKKAEYNINESMITGRYKDFLNKSRIIDFTINEVLELTTPSGTARQTGLFKLDFTGLGNSYNSKSVDNKIIVNEGVVDVLNKNEFYTDGKQIFMVKGKTVVNENAETKKNIVNEDVNKMKHFLNYNGSKFVNTNNVKKDRGF
jgi:hypothetical protein